MTYQILQGDNRQILKTLEDNSIDAIVTDPPYGINFLGKTWDADTGSLETYKECLRVLKPGGHILAFSAARTYHYLAITLEQAGFEIRDQIMWIYSSGFPKSQDIGRQIQKKLGVKEKKAHKHNIPRIGGDVDISIKDNGQTVCTDPQAKAWEGWGTALKPAHEPICLARKPLKQSIAANVQQYGTGALNIDATRVPFEDGKVIKGGALKVDICNSYENIGKDQQAIATNDWQGNPAGRFTSNVIGDLGDYQKFFYCPKVSSKERHIGFGETISNDEMVEEMGGHFLNGNSVWLPHTGNIYTHGIRHEYLKWCKENNKESAGRFTSNVIGDLGDYQKFFYCPKVSRKERHIGHKMPPAMFGNMKGAYDDNGQRYAVELDKRTDNTGNTHPTVKLVDLMKYLIKLITPKGGTVLDPFNGSGSTGMAAVELGFDYIGCELDPEYVKISEVRIAAWLSKDIEPEVKTNSSFDDLFE